MTESQQSATTAALRQLDIPVQSSVVVAGLSAKSPSAGKLRKGDVVLSVDGNPVDGGGALRDEITATKAGRHAPPRRTAGRHEGARVGHDRRGRRRRPGHHRRQHP